MKNLSAQVLELDIDFDDTGVNTIVPRCVLIDTLVSKASKYRGTMKYRLVIELGNVIEIIDYAVNYDPTNDDSVSEPIGNYASYTTPHSGYETLLDWIDCVDIHSAIKNIECTKRQHYANKAYTLLSHQVIKHTDYLRALQNTLEEYYDGDLELDRDEVQKIQTDLRLATHLILEYPDSQLGFFTGVMDAFYSWLKDF